MNSIGQYVPQTCADDPVDLSDVLAAVRNDLVHPRRKYELHDDAVFYAWNVAQWYLERFILRICGYEGDYQNRLKYLRGEAVSRIGHGGSGRLEGPADWRGRGRGAAW